MRAGSVQQETVIASVFLAGATVLVAGVAGHLLLGAGVGAGLVLGSLNGFMIQAMLDRGAPIAAASLLRLGVFTALALVAARFAGGSVWPLVIVIAAAQLVMVGVGVRQGQREGRRA